MKKTLTFNSSTIESTASKVNLEAWDASIEAFENKEFLKSFYSLLDYLNPEFRSKYGNAEGTEFNIPHGSIVVNLKLEDGQLKINAPFVSLPEKGKIPLLRQVAGLNFRNMDLARISLKDDKLYFEYSCPADLVNPYKIYYVLEEICKTGDRYDDEFETKFGAKRIYEPKIVAYSDDEINMAYDVVRLSCKECLDAIDYFEPARKYNHIWNIIDSTILKLFYCVHPQGQLMNDLDKAIMEMDRDDIPLPEIVAHGKEVILKLQGMSKEQLAENLYHVETFIPDKRRSNLKNIQDNFEDTFNKVTAALEAGDAMACCLMIVYKFYEMYYYNSVQDDVNAVVVKAMKKASAQPWEEAAPVLHEAMEAIMEGELDEDDEDEESGEMDMSAYMQNVQQMQQQAMQAMQGIDMEEIQKMQQQAMQNFNMDEYMKNVQDMMKQMMGGNKSDNDK